MRKIGMVASGALVGLLMFAGAVQAQGANGSVIVAEGFSAPNAYAGPLPDFFDDWCDGVCVPTVQLDVYDVQKTRRLGTIYAWGKEFLGSGVTLQFKEFILYDFSGGQVYTLSQDGGHPGGAFADTTLVPPKHGDVVLVGGAEGLVVGGTGKYAKASGGYSTRLKVEQQGPYFIYYDELYFRFRNLKIE